MSIGLDTIEIAVTYLAKRQLQGRPTTLRQLGKRMGISSRQIMDAVETVGVQYTLVPHESLGGRVKWGNSNIEVLLRHIPEKYGKVIGIEAKKVEESFRSILGEDPKPLTEYLEAQEHDALFGDKLDAFSGYRISKDQYEVLKEHLITFEELVQVGREQGYSVASIRRATGGDRMRLPLPSMFWRPYVLGKQRFYLKDVLDHLIESDRTYKSRTRMQNKRRERYGDPEENKFIVFAPRKSTPRTGRKERENE